MTRDALCEEDDCFLTSLAYNLFIHSCSMALSRTTGMEIVSLQGDSQNKMSENNKVGHAGVKLSYAADASPRSTAFLSARIQSENIQSRGDKRPIFVCSAMSH